MSADSTGTGSGPVKPALDVSTARSNLNAALGPTNSPAYWNALRQYTRGETSKADLDTTALALLGPDNLHLHTRFFKSIRHSAAAASVSSTPDDSRTRRRPQRPSQKDINQSASLVTGLSAEAAQQPATAPPPANIGASAPHASVLDLGRQTGAEPLSGMPATSSTGSASLPRNPTSLCASAGALPDMLSLRARLFMIAFEHGLSDVSEQTAALVLEALRYHMLDIVQKCIWWKRRLRRTPSRHCVSGTGLSHIHPPDQYLVLDHSDQVENDPITAEDLFVATSMAPNLWGDNQLAPHRLLARLGARQRRQR